MKIFLVETVTQPQTSGQSLPGSSLIMDAIKKRLNSMKDNITIVQNRYTSFIYFPFFYANFFFSSVYLIEFT
jgi:hypothetical protein